MFARGCTTVLAIRRQAGAVVFQSICVHQQQQKVLNIPHIAGLGLVGDNKRSSVLLQQLRSDPTQWDP